MSNAIRSAAVEPAQEAHISMCGTCQTGLPRRRTNSSHTHSKLTCGVEGHSLDARTRINRPYPPADRQCPLYELQSSHASRLSLSQPTTVVPTYRPLLPPTKLTPTLTLEVPPQFQSLSAIRCKRDPPTQWARGEQRENEGRDVARAVEHHGHVPDAVRASTRVEFSRARLGACPVHISLPPSAFPYLRKVRDRRGSTSLSPRTPMSPTRTSQPRLQDLHNDL